MARKEAKAKAGVETPPPPSTPSVHVWEPKVLEELEFDGLYELHKEFCSREVPECQKTFLPRDFRAHVIKLVTEKQKRIA